MAFEVSLFPVDAKTCIWILLLEYKQAESWKVAKLNNEHFVNEGEGGGKGGDEDGSDGGEGGSEVMRMVVKVVRWNDGF